MSVKLYRSFRLSRSQSSKEKSSQALFNPTRRRVIRARWLLIANALGCEGKCLRNVQSPNSQWIGSTRYRSGLFTPASYQRTNSSWTLVSLVRHFRCIEENKRWDFTIFRDLSIWSASKLTLWTACAYIRPRQLASSLFLFFPCLCIYLHFYLCIYLPIHLSFHCNTSWSFFSLSRSFRIVKIKK